MLVSARISRLLDTCLSVIHNANYIVNSIVCAVILVRGSRGPSYGIRPMHGKIHVVNMHGTGTKHIVRHSQKSVVQWSVISKFTCTHISTINMYKFIKIRHEILIQCHGNYMEMKKLNYMLGIDILRNSSHKFLGVLRVAF